MPPLSARFSLIVAALSLPAATSAHEGHLDHADHAEPVATSAETATPLFTVDGFLARLAEPLVRMETRGDQRLIAANGLPDHATGRFPNRGNPNAISAQQYQFRMPLDPAPPAAGSQPRDTRGYVFGVALNGVPFDPGTAENWTANGIQRGGRPTGWRYEALGGAVQLGVDQANAHVQPTGAYHYHGIPTPMLNPNQPTLLGYAADGYPVYGPLGYEDPIDPTSRLVDLQPSYELKTDPRPDLPQGPGGKPDGSFTEDWQYTPNLGDLDQANGRFGVTPEYPDGTYHYVLTEAFPHIPRHFAGNPDNSFRKRGGGERPNRGERGERGQRSPRGERPR